MFKKIELWIVCLICLIFIVITIFYGALLRDHHLNVERFQKIKKVAIFFSEIPTNIKKFNKLSLRKTERNKIIIENKDDMPTILATHSNKPRFNRFINTNRNVLLVLPRYDGNIKRAVVDIIDLNTFEVLHTYKHDITSMNNLIDKSNIEFSTLKIDKSEIRFEYFHPLILDDGSLISSTQYSPLFKIDICSDLVWVNQEERFHHSIMGGNDEQILLSLQMFPYSEYVKKFIQNFGYQEDSIAKLNKNGKITFKKSIVEMLFENNILNENEIFLSNDPIHLNDVEPIFFDSLYWKKGDLFLSLRHQSAIVHYRPSTNKVINYIKGPFYEQHDIDIISNKEISIFNNNNSALNNSNISEVLIYNFEEKTFSKKFQKQLKENNFKTTTQGLSEILKDGSMLVEEQNHGRLIFFNQFGEKEWEFINKDNNGNVYFISWSRIIEDKKLINKLKKEIKNKKC